MRFRTVSALCLVTLAGCADRATPTGPVDPEPPPTSASAMGRRAILDSLYGPAAGDIDSAVVALDRDVRRDATAWLDSVVRAVPFVEGEVSNERAMRDAAPVTGTHTREARFTTHGKRVTVRIESVQNVSFPDGVKVQIEQYTRDLVRTVDDAGNTVPNSAVVGYEQERNLFLNACPDESGRASGLYDATYSTNAVKAGGDEIPLPELADYQFVERLDGGVRLWPDDAAVLDRFDDAVTHRVSRTYFHGTARTGSASLTRALRPFADLYSAPGALQNVTGAYDDLVDAQRTGGIDGMLFDYDGVVERGARLAERLWRSGACVEVHDAAGDTQPASSGATIDLHPYILSRVDATVRHGGTMDATATGGSVTPTFRYTAPNGGGGSVAFRSVSKHGIGVGRVTFTTIDGGAEFSFGATTNYVIDSRDGDEHVTGSLTGQAQLDSRLTLVPRAPEAGDLRAWSLVATTQVALDGSGEGHSRGYDDGRLVGDASFRMSGTGTSHNPARASDPEFDAHTFDQFPQSRDTAGTLVVFKRGAKYYYAMDLQLTGIVPTFQANGTMTYRCTDVDAPTVLKQSWSNATRTYTNDIVDPGSCIPHGGGYTADLPLGFGAVVVRRTGADPVTHRSEMFIGELDPRTGIIEGSEERTLTDCNVVGALDPLQLAWQLHLVKSWISQIAYEQGSCSLRYTVRWRLLVPPLL